MEGGVANSENPIQASEVVLPCTELESTLSFFTEILGFQINAIFPAEAPLVAVISGYGVRLRLERGGSGSPGKLRLLCRNPEEFAEGATELTAPNGTCIEIVEADPPLVLPPEQQSFVLNRYSNDASWEVGRAGMNYRDLIPNRQGGRFIASHIRIPEGGPVPDYVHFHKIRFQMIYCYKGWVRVVYDEQGPPFVMHSGDCVLQPPQIRHRVLESSAGLEVIEISCPAEHETWADPDLDLPTTEVRSNRDFGGQHFVLHQVVQAEWSPWRMEGFEFRDTGIGTATKGLAGVRVVRPLNGSKPLVCSHSGEFYFFFTLEGGVTLICEGLGSQRMEAGDSCVIPAQQRHALTDCSDDLELLEATFPAELETQLHSMSVEALMNIDD
ncbi:MAG TPA: cupin [Candidatus Marinimicrobia bacterium]|nr:cupin [Candidatus Neomarinimicrobiota bacterium]